MIRVLLLLVSLSGIFLIAGRLGRATARLECATPDPWIHPEALAIWRWWLVTLGLGVVLGLLLAGPAGADDHWGADEVLPAVPSMPAPPTVVVVPQYVPQVVPVYPQSSGYDFGRRNYTAGRPGGCRVVCVGTRCQPVCW